MGGMHNYSGESYCQAFGDYTALETRTVSHIIHHCQTPCMTVFRISTARKLKNRFYTHLSRRHLLIEYWQGYDSAEWRLSYSWIQKHKIVSGSSVLFANSPLLRRKTMSRTFRGHLSSYEWFRSEPVKRFLARTWEALTSILPAQARP